MRLIILILLSILSIACNSQKNGGNNANKNSSIQTKNQTQIGDYVTSVYEDSKGDLWFGTLSKGIARYDGERLTYLTQKDGLPSDRVTGVLEDSDGIFWFKTGSGLSMYDGKDFTNILVQEGFLTNMISTATIDSEGTFWVGTWGGVYTFDRKDFQPFPIPHPSITTPINEDTKNWITEIKEDPDGNMWFGRDGYGACKYDGEFFTFYLKKDGLLSNNITEIEFDDNGNAWIGTRVTERDNPDPEKRFGKGGINRLSQGSITSFPEIEAFNSSDVYEVHKDKEGNIWICTTKSGVYKYDGMEFNHYDVPISIMDMMDDSKGNLWLCGAGGLYRINEKGEILNITTDGPWE